MMQDMDTIDLAVAIRGYDLRVLEQNRMLRWMVAALLSPHSKKPISPTKILPLWGDNGTPAKKGNIREKLDAAEKIFELWDDPATEWTILGKKEK